MKLSPHDAELVNGLAFDPDATIAFHEILGCLVWSDEVPEGLTAGGHDYLRDLLAARGALHRGAMVDLTHWNDARASGLAWNGFRRIDLTAEQQALLDRYVADQSEL